MRNAKLDELQARIKIGRTNINNLRYVDDTTLMAESKEELKNLLMKVKEKSGLSPFLWRAPRLGMRRECRKFFSDFAGTGSLLSSYEA